MDRSHRPDAGKAAGCWALDVLEGVLGTDWVAKAVTREGRVPDPFLHASMHAVAFAQTLEWALRLHVLKGVPGMGRVRSQLAGDARSDRRAHTNLQLEVAALALREGLLTSVESGVHQGGPPADLMLTESMAVETFVVLSDQGMRQSLNYGDQVGKRVMSISIHYDVAIEGKLEEELSAEDTKAWLDRIEEAASSVAATGQEIGLDSVHGPVRVMRRTPTSGTHSFQGPTATAQGWPRTVSRLREKAEQAQRSGARWLRLDLLDGFWQFTSWATSPFAEKTEALAHWAREALADSRWVGGVVLSCGAADTQGGAYVTETYEGTNAVLGIRRPIAPARVREAVIVPLRAGSLDDAAMWLKLYNDEGGWLDWALARAGLPPASEVLGFIPMDV
jgi:hypothetical protein